MPKVKANGITINYEQQGAGEPLVLIPYLAADYACYSFQVADYAKHFTCISVDPRGAGETDKPPGTYSMELFADDVAALMQAIGVATGACERPIAWRGDRTMACRQISGTWSNRCRCTAAGPRATLSSRSTSQGWQSMAKGLGDVTEMVIQGIFPCASRRNCMRPSRTISISSQLSCAAGRSSPSMHSSANRAR